VKGEVFDAPSNKWEPFELQVGQKERLLEFGIGVSVQEAESA
jgi:hypothetical protein